MGGLPSSPISPPLTEKNIPNQSGKVFVVTGATSGIGFELAQILYAAHAKVWLVARSSSKGQASIDSIRSSCPNSKGRLELLIADFDDLQTIKSAVDKFLDQEDRIDVLWNNAGIMIPPKGTVTKQDYEAQLGVNVVAPHLFTKLLTPTLIRTSVAEPAGKTRVVWISSSATERFAPPGGVDMDELKKTNKYSQWQNYGMSKAAAIFQAAEFAKRYGEHGLVSVAADPGNLDTNLYKDVPKYMHFIAKKMALKPAVFGAYTELFAGLSDSIGTQNNGTWVIPWGATAACRKDIDDQRDGVAPRFWDWCEK